MNNKNTFYFGKKLNVLNYKNLIKILVKNKIKIFIHIAALSRPMSIHDTNVDLSIQTNIGTANVVRAYKIEHQIDLFSTNYVYPCTKYKETDTLLPINNYAWSKLGGSLLFICSRFSYSSVVYYRLSFYIKRLLKCLLSFLYNKDFARIFSYLLDEKGILNIGGKRQSIYNFAKKDNPSIKAIRNSKKINFPYDSSLDIKKFQKILKKKSIKI